MKNKLAIVIPTLHGAGCEKLVSEMLFSFEKDFDIDLILYENNIDYEIPKSINIKLVGTDNSPYHNMFYKIYRLWKRIYNIGKILKVNNYDAILSFIDGCNINVYFAVKLFGIKIPLILAERTINENFFKYNPYSKKYAKLFKNILKIIYTNSDYVTVNSETMKTYLKNEIKVVNNNIAVIYNGINSKIFNLTMNNKNTLEKHFISAKIKLLNVARLDDNKNQQYLIKLMPDLLKKQPEIKLFLIGKGEKEEELTKLIVKLNLHDKVYLLGWKANVADYMRKSDLFLMSSKYESFGNVLAESLFCGTPVISSNYNDVVYDILYHDDFGKVVELENIEEYKETILYYLDKKIDKTNISELSRKKFTLGTTSSSYIKLIQKVINDKKYI